MNILNKNIQHKASGFHMAKHSLPWFVIVLALGHGVIDMAAGWVAGYLMGDDSQHDVLFDRSDRVIIGLLLFNLIAFGLQPLIGLWADTKRNPSRLIILATSGIAVAAICMMGIALNDKVDSLGMLFGFVLLPLASGAFHVGAGGLVLLSSATPRTAGWWAAPGILGQGLGATAALLNLNIAWPLVLVLACLGLAAWRLQEVFSPRTGGPFEMNSIKPVLGGIAFIVLIVMSLRSAVWLIAGIQILKLKFLLTIGVLPSCIFAALGKAVGGEMSARIDAKRWTVIALFGAALCFSFSLSLSQMLLLNWACLGVGMFFLQSTVPSLWWMQAQSLPGKLGLATGLSLGLASILGGVLLVIFSIFRDQIYSDQLITLGIVLLTVLAALGAAFSWKCWPKCTDSTEGELQR